MHLLLLQYLLISVGFVSTTVIDHFSWLKKTVMKMIKNELRLTSKPYENNCTIWVKIVKPSLHNSQ